MVILSGLFDNMVLQRSADNNSDALFGGECSNEGSLVVKVEKGGKALKGFSGVRVGIAHNKAFSATLLGLPSGGPYEITISIENKAKKQVEQCKVKNVLVGDVWILGGQSNMEGIGRLSDALKPDPLVRAFYMNDTWDIARDPIHALSIAVDQVHIDLSGGVRPLQSTITGVGPGLSFAKEMYRFSAVPQGVIACAHGGTSMEQWDPAKKEMGGKSLYGAMQRRFHKNGSKVAGVVWYQGCSDADDNQAGKYTERMKMLVSSMRRDFKNKDLPFVAVQIGSVCDATGYSSKPWNWIQEQQRLLPKVIKNISVVPVIDLSLDDAIHISGFDQARVGKRCAQAMAALQKLPGAPKSPIELASVKAQKDPATGGLILKVTYSNVMGKLEAKDRPWGFEVSQKSFDLTHNAIYRTDLDGNSAIVRTGIPFGDADALCLYYGFGRHPFCNITDSADRSIPVMGPIRFAKEKAITPYLTTMMVSAFQPPAGKLNGLAYPADTSALELKPRNFVGTFCSLHEEILKMAPRDMLVYYRIKFKAPEPMKTRFDVGYDGPLKIWIDRKEMFHDPEGINPAFPGDAFVPFNAPAGEHEITVALATNYGAAWGIFLRCERTDIDKALIKKGPEYYAMPDFFI